MTATAHAPERSRLIRVGCTCWKLTSCRVVFHHHSHAQALSKATFQSEQACQLDTGSRNKSASSPAGLSCRQQGLLEETHFDSSPEVVVRGSNFERRVFQGLKHRSLLSQPLPPISATSVPCSSAPLHVLLIFPTKHKEARQPFMKTCQHFCYLCPALCFCGWNL